MSTLKRLVSMTVAVGIVASLGIGPATAMAATSPASLESVEVAGDTRYATAVESSKLAFESGAANLVIASGENWPDAVTASSLAGRLRAPLLLTRRDSLPAVIASEISRLGSQNVIVIGGEASVSAAVMDELTALVGEGGVRRVCGENRYETAYAVAREVVRLAADSYDGRVFVATGETFADALAVAPLASVSGRPIFLAAPGMSDALFEEMMNRGAGEVVILGGTGSVGADLESKLASVLGSGNVKRIAGSDRYATAVAIAEYSIARGGFGWDGVGIATGTDFPDALAGGTTLGARGSVLLLTRQTGLSAPTAAALSANKADIHTVLFFGDTHTLDDSIRSSVEKALR